MTFDDLTRLEPELARLERHIKQIGRKRGQQFCANSLWYAYFKPKLEGLVGFGSRRQFFRSMECYDVAYRHLYRLLPDCVHDDRMCG